MTLSDAVDEEKAKIKHSLRVLDFSVFCQNHEKVRERAALLTSYASRLYYFIQLNLPPPPSKAHAYVHAAIHKEQFR